MSTDIAARSLAWRRAKLRAVCDVFDPWEFGRVARASRYPNYFDLNALLVERPTGLGVAGLLAAADEHLAGLGHRRIEFEVEEEANGLVEDFRRRGWRSSRLVCMRHTGSAGGPGEAATGEVVVREVEYDVVRGLRLAWHREDFGDASTDYIDDAREVSMARGCSVLAAIVDDAPIGFVQLEQADDAVEVEDVFVLPQHRGRGVGGAITAGAVRWALAQKPRDLWIVADADGRPQHLYERLGFAPVRWWREFLLFPVDDAGGASSGQ